MFDNWKLRRLLKRRITEAEGANQTAQLMQNREFIDNFLEYKILADTEFAEIKQKLSQKRLKKAADYGIDLPAHWLITYELSGRSFTILTDEGDRKVNYMIRQKSRESKEYWVKVIVTVLTALTGLVGAITGLLAIYQRK